MSGMLLPLFVAVPLLAGGLLLTVGRRPRLQIGALWTVAAGSLAGAVALIVEVAVSGPLAHGIGLWPVGIAIPFAADMLTALLLAATALLTLVCALFAAAAGTAEGRYFSPMVLIMMGGVSGALLTADLFNLFVFIEVMLLPSYALLVLAPNGAGTMGQVRGARPYVTVNLLTSTVFLAGVAFIYGITGTVNLAELAGAAHENDAVAAAAAVCLFALCIKAAVVPVHGWLARTYPATSPAITALFSGLHTKVAVYGIYRLYAQLFDGDDRFLSIGLVVFTITMIVGVLAAVGESTTRSILTFHMVSQIGYILIGVGLFTGTGLAAGIFYLVHNMVAKAGLFLAAGAIEVRYDTGRLAELGGMGRREPWVAAAFMISALSMAGLPPFSGFVAKLTIATAALEAGHVALVIAMLLVSLITLLSMLKIWSGIFWGPPPPEPDSPETGGPIAVGTRPQVGVALAAPAMILVAITLALGLGAEGLLQLAELAAASLLDTAPYTQAVMGA